MPYLNLDFNYFDHPKTRRLAALLGPMSEVLPLRLWSYCAKVYPRDGVMRGHSEAEVLALLNVGELNGISPVAAMVRVGFLAKTEDGFKCVDWKQHQGHIWALTQRNRKAANSRWARMRDAYQNDARRMPHTIPNQTEPVEQQKVVGGENQQRKLTALIASAADRHAL